MNQLRKINILYVIRVLIPHTSSQSFFTSDKNKIADLLDPSDCSNDDTRVNVYECDLSDYGFFGHEETFYTVTDNGYQSISFRYNEDTQPALQISQQNNPIQVLVPLKKI